MADIRSGDKIMLSGYSGEDSIIANNWAKNFAEVEIRRGDFVHWRGGSGCKNCLLVDNLSLIQISRVRSTLKCTTSRMKNYPI